jgi:hypothetical protein
MVREIHPSQSIRGQQMRDKLQAPCPHGVPGSKDRMRLSRLHRHNLFITRMKNNRAVCPHFTSAMPDTPGASLPIP